MEKSEKEIRAYIIGGKGKEITTSKEDLRYIIDGKCIPKRQEIYGDEGISYSSLIAKLRSIVHIFTEAEWEIMNDMIKAYEAKR